MPSKDQVVDIEGHQIKLSNLDKVLFPKAGIVKAELISYYLSVSPYMLPYLIGRPMTLIRYPDGVNGERFYSKNKPTWTPAWIGSVKTDEADDNTYITVNDQASLIWCANLAALELHPMQVRANAIHFPDQIIFDLDPPDDSDFEVVKLLAFRLKDFLSKYGYHPFVKTSGSKGLHVYVPIHATYDQEIVVRTAKSLATEIVAMYPETTLILNKEKRAGKVLMDIYRNNKSQTCVAPYSTRGKEGAPVSMPITWSELETVTSSQQYDIHNAVTLLKQRGDAWQDFYKYASALHDQSNAVESNAVKQQLQTYDAKRDFTKTSEPSSSASSDLPLDGNNYVVHLHDASNLHYDLRLEFDGILRSWAIPKGLPEMEDVKRLAIETEPHPLKYLHFEGVIPKEEYGGGEMWIFDKGKYEFLKREEKSLKIKLQDGALAGEFVLYNTKDNQWIIERKSHHRNVNEIEASPMLASQIKDIPSAAQYDFEIKWDGIRVTAYKTDQKIKLISRNGNDITDKFPLIKEELKNFEAEGAVLDGEIVVLESDGKPNFSKVISRMHLVGVQQIEKAAISNPAAFYLFDAIYLDGRDLRKEPIERRRSWLKANLNPGKYVRFSESFPDGTALFEAAKLHGMEGIMCKKKGSTYLSGARSSDWAKVKVRNGEDALIIGYTKGQGDRADVFGALHLAKPNEDGSMQYMGKVGTGFNMALLKEIMSKLSLLTVTSKPIKESIEEEYNTIWVEPKLWCEINYASMTSNNTYREPVFERLREEL